ncbi:MAG: hypothetical protein AB1650_08840 [Candidatus Omnitrophota bacterium]
MKKRSTICRVFSACLSAILAVTFAVPACAQSTLNLPAVEAMITPSIAYHPPIMAGMTIHPDNPLEFNFLITTGDDDLEGETFRKESQKLINYFFATLTVPDDEMWVNLSPYEKDRIIADGLSQTEMGRDMLVQDYILKQFTASLMYPEETLGDQFWKRVYAKTQARFGTTGIPTNTFNKVWIVPEKAVVYVNGTNAFVSESHLKVMLEEDYLALENNQGSTKHGLGKMAKDNVESISQEAKEAIREIIIPEIEKEVNEGKNFANLRQIYYSMILATWYKTHLRESVLGQVYMDKNKIQGIDLEDKKVKEKIYDQYVEAFKKGVYNYIKEDYDGVTQEIIPKKYFSGGIIGEKKVVVDTDLNDASEVVRSAEGKTELIDVESEVRLIAYTGKVLGNVEQETTSPDFPIVSKDANIVAASSITLDEIEIRDIRIAPERDVDLLKEDLDSVLGVPLLISVKLKVRGKTHEVEIRGPIGEYINVERRIHIIVKALKKLGNLSLTQLLQNQPELEMFLLENAGLQQDRDDPAGTVIALGLRALSEKSSPANAVRGDKNPEGFQLLGISADTQNNGLPNLQSDAMRPGGIDFNSRSLNLKEQGQKVDFVLDNSMLNDMPANYVEGVSPVIISITPIADVASLLGRN